MEGGRFAVENRRRQHMRQRIILLGCALVVVLVSSAIVAFVAYSYANMFLAKEKLRQLEELTARLQVRFDTLEDVDKAPAGIKSRTDLQTVLEELGSLRKELNHVEFIQQRRYDSEHAVIQGSIDNVSKGRPSGGNSVKAETHHFNIAKRSLMFANVTATLSHTLDLIKT